eukprot:5501481-Amphidinium_carterae.1
MGRAGTQNSAAAKPSTKMSCSLQSTCKHLDIVVRAGKWDPSCVMIGSLTAFQFFIFDSLMPVCKELARAKSGRHKAYQSAAMASKLWKEGLQDFTRLHE